MSPQEKTIHELNAVIAELGTTLPDYRPYNFTFETSTGKLWWARLSNGYCQDRGGAVLAEEDMRLSELDQNSVSTATDKDGHAEVVVGCKGNVACIEDWISPTCGSIDNFHYDSHDAEEAVSKAFKENGKETVLRFGRRMSQLQILTTGDPDSSTRAITLLKQLIGQAPPPSDAFLAEVTQQKAEAEQQQAEQKAKDEAQAQKINTLLSPLQGTWHANLGAPDNVSGRAHNKDSAGSFDMDVGVFVEKDFDLNLGAPDGNLASGWYATSHERWIISGSTLPLFENDCFYVAGGCFVTYSWNRTEAYVAAASVGANGRIHVNFTNYSCQGDCETAHRPDRSGEIELLGPSILRIRVGNAWYELTKQ